MHFGDQSGVLALIRLLLGGGESGHPDLLGYYEILDIGVSLNYIMYFLHTHTYIYV